MEYKKTFFIWRMFVKQLDENVNDLWLVFLSCSYSRKKAVMKWRCFSEDRPMPVANYLEFGSELKIKVNLAYPLNACEEDMKDVKAAQVDEVWS